MTSAKQNGNQVITGFKHISLLPNQMTLIYQIASHKFFKSQTKHLDLKNDFLLTPLITGGVQSQPSLTFKIWAWVFSNDL